MVAEARPDCITICAALRLRSASAAARAAASCRLRSAASAALRAGLGLAYGSLPRLALAARDGRVHRVKFCGAGRGQNAVALFERREGGRKPWDDRAVIRLGRGQPFLVAAARI